MNRLYFFDRKIFIAGACLASVLFAIPWFASALTITPPRIETVADPGTTVKQAFKIFNEEKQSKTYYILTQNFEAKDETGEPNFVEGKENLVGWIQAPESVTMGPGENRNVDFSINVPANAEPGGYFTALFLQTTPPTFEQGSGVGVGSQLGTLILLRVNGDISDQAGILDFATQGNERWFTNLPIEFYYRFQNTGVDRIRPLGDIIITNTVGMRSKILNANANKGNVLPKSIRRFQAVWANGGGGVEATDIKFEAPELNGFWKNVSYQWHHFALGYYSAKLNLAYGSDPVKIADQSFGFFVFPWQLMVVLVVGGILLLIILRYVIKNYNAWVIKRATPAKSTSSVKSKRG